MGVQYWLFVSVYSVVPGLAAEDGWVRAAGLPPSPDSAATTAPHVTGKTATYTAACTSCPYWTTG